MRILLLMIFFAVFAQEGMTMNKAEALDLLNEANQNFDQEKYAEAIALYESVSEEFTSVQLQHNLGLAYFYSGELAKSILHMERALKLRPGSVRIKRNLRLLNENIESEITRVPTFFLKSWFNGISNLMSAFAWMILNLLFLVIVAILLYQYLIMGWDLGLHFYYIRGLIIGIFVFSLLFLAFGYGRNIRANSSDAGIIKSNNTILRVAAEENSQEVDEVNEGVKVFIQDEIDNFYKIKLEDYTEAWVLKSDIEMI